MAWSRVAAGTVAANSGSSVSPTFGATTTAGNMLVCFVADSGSTVTVSGTGWTRVAGDLTGGGSGDLGCDIWIRGNCGAGESAPTVTTSGLSAFAMLAEFSGGGTAPTRENHAGSTGAAAATPVTATCASSDAASGDLILACEYISLSKAGTHTSSITLNNGATATGNENNDASSVSFHYRFCYGVTTGTVADSAQAASNSMSLSGINVSVASIVAGSAAAAATPPRPKVMLQAVGRAASW